MLAISDRRRRWFDIVEEVGLSVRLPRLAEERELVRPKIWIVAIRVRVASEMAAARRRQGQEICAQRAFVAGPIGPERAPRFPKRSQAFVVRDGVLNDERLYPIRMGQGHPKPHRAAVILHVKRVVGESERFGEAIHDFGEVVKRVGECFRLRPIAVPEAWVVGRDEVIAIGQPGEKRFVHPRRRRKPVAEEERRRVLRARLPVENGEPVDLCCAIEGRGVHGASLLLGLRQHWKRRDGQRQTEHARPMEPMTRSEKSHLHLR